MNDYVNVNVNDYVNDYANDYGCNILVSYSLIILY